MNLATKNVYQFGTEQPFPRQLCSIIVSRLPISINHPPVSIGEGYEMRGLLNGAEERTVEPPQRAGNQRGCEAH